MRTGSRLGEAWSNTMRPAGRASGAALAHAGAPLRVAARRIDRVGREEAEDAALSPGATRARGAGQRARTEEPDAFRQCFEVDRDRIVHSRAFRRLAGKTQVFVFPADHQRTRLTHALEVAQVAGAVARGTGLNVALTEAIALGHDCGHGPGGHASEDVFDARIPGGFHHARFGAAVVLAPLNLCAETLDGIASHSWSLPAPATPEGEVVSWADRIAYCAHDLEDALHAGVLSAEELPAPLVATIGESRPRQLSFFINAMIETVLSSGVIGMAEDAAEALAALRQFNYERIYHRPESLQQGAAVVSVLSALTDHFAAHPGANPLWQEAETDPMFCAVQYVNGMTDRFAFAAAVEQIGYPEEELPRGIDLPVR